MCSNSLARQFSSMFHAKCLQLRLDRLLPLRSCLQNFYQCPCVLVRPNEPNQPDPTQPEFGHWGPNLTQPEKTGRVWPHYCVHYTNFTNKKFQKRSQTLCDRSTFKSNIKQVLGLGIHYPPLSSISQQFINDYSVT